MSLFKRSTSGYQLNGEAGDHAASCELCGTLFEAPGLAAALAAAQSCEENHRGGSDAYDNVPTDLYPHGSARVAIAATRE